MATGTRQSNTMVEGLRKLVGQITELKMTEDADLPFLINLETQVLQYIKQGADQALQGPPAMGGGAPAGLMGSAAPPPGMGSPPGTAGLMQGPAMPNPDELRRVLSQR